MNRKRILGSHTAHYPEARVTNNLLTRDAVHRALAGRYSLDQTSQAAFDVHRNLHQGKVGVLCLAPSDGLGVKDSVHRERHLQAIMRFRSE
jgi:crotonyl-CoA reductase